MTLEVIATLWPEMRHYKKFSKDSRVSGIRLNTAMADRRTLPRLLDQALDLSNGKDLYFDVKGRQLRVTSVSPRCDRLELRVNHPIEVETPTPVIFKAGEDYCVLDHLKDERTLVFRGGPQYDVKFGESLQIRAPSLKVKGEVFTDRQKEFLDMALKAGITQFMLSYTGGQDEIDEMRKYVGTLPITAKIETQKGLAYVANDYVAAPNLRLLNARGDLFIEVEKPHDIAQASRDIVKADPEAIVGSRILLSMTHERVPSCADIGEIAFLKEIGYRRFMFCDSLCLDGKALDRAVHCLTDLYNAYTPQRDEKRPWYQKLLGIGK